MTFNIIMAACMYPALLLLYAVLWAQGKPRAGLLFGARLQEGWTKDTGLEQVGRRFKRQMLIALLALGVIPLGFLLIPYSSICYTLWMVWLCAALAALCLPFARANRAVRDWKAEHGLASSAQAERLAELKGVEAARKVRLLPFLLPLLISLAAAVVPAAVLRGRGMGMLHFIQASFALCTLIYYLAALWMDRQRLRVISADSEVNLNYNRAKRRHWNHFWLFCAWLNTALAAVLAALILLRGFEAEMGAILWGSVVYAVLLLAGILVLMGRLSGLDNRYRDRMELASCGEDDDRWLGGMIYYNPQDRRVVIEKRVGIGTTLNMAAPAGKAMAVFLAAVLFGLALSCVWLIRLEFTPLRLSVTEEAVVAAQLGEDYHIPLDAVRDLTLVEELPSCTRVNGAGMENLCKGTYRIRDTGERCELFLNPENGVFLRFTSEGTTYYMSAATDGGTLEIYRQLTEGR